MIARLEHVIAVCVDGSPAWCSCGHVGDLDHHAAEVLAPPVEPDEFTD